MLISAAEIRGLIPHAGTMCLIDGVLAWNEAHIDATSQSHLDPHHPLRRHGHLAALHAFEYGAQAAAIHGALLARAMGKPSSLGYLASLRGGQLLVDRLETIAGELTIAARILFGENANAIYECRIEGDNQLLARVRLSIIERPSTSLKGGSCGIG